MDDYEVLEEYDDGRLFVRLRSGDFSGYTILLVPKGIPCRAAELRWREPGDRSMTRVTCSWSPAERAERLLVSLLNSHQQESWRRSKKFQVTTPFGVVELGDYHDMAFWPSVGGEYRLCVVPTTADMPMADIWANLLLTLKRDPEWFLTVANWRQPPAGVWNFGPVPGIRASV